MLAGSTAFAGNIIVQAGGGSGTITGVTAGTGISGGGSSGNVTVTNTGVLSVSSTSTGGTPITGAVQLLPGSNVTLTQSGQGITIASSGGGGGTAISDGRLFCPSELSPCTMDSSAGQVHNLSSAAVHCEGFTGGVPGSASISISSVSFFTEFSASQIAFGFYDASGNLLRQTISLSVPTTGPYTATMAPLTLTTGTKYYECVAQSSSTFALYVHGPYDYEVFAQDQNSTASTYNLFIAGNNSTTGSGGAIVMPSAFGSRTEPGLNNIWIWAGGLN